ncbi:hypothetical protein LOTGIDRAFT_169625 [Lottia gigantea]|uniref:LRAT domain-containing protein n=1 Tax=Lottia gigantea TaxID=225164 RepID=V3ZGD4_LOTGI|nr:hypothetical protein LOTGIDRAFT_169625 [Lottia gigantea]ESO83217.1 hypothetical protein LOTGIDRAFT_169625 [Lottia gigantea]
MLKRLGKFVTAEYLINNKNVELNIGDLIEVDRTIYSDWALYIGHGEVAHLAGIETDIPNEEAIVEICELSEMADKHLVRVNNKEIPAKQRSLKPQPINVIMNSVMKLQSKVVPFNLMTRNFEHYVTEWRYGKGWSDQASTALSSMTMFSKPLKDPKCAHNAMLNGINMILESPANSPSP